MSWVGGQAGVLPKRNLFPLSAGDCFPSPFAGLEPKELSETALSASAEVLWKNISRKIYKSPAAQIPEKPLVPCRSQHRGALSFDIQLRFPRGSRSLMC
ncbi:hypothetical protein SRHO_G00127750 [Serrasalmus rhombeus]